VIFVGIDWAEAHHDACVVDEAGAILGKVRVPDGVEGVRRLHELVAEHVVGPSDVAVGSFKRRLQAGVGIAGKNPSEDGLSARRWHPNPNSSAATTNAWSRNGFEFVSDRRTRTKRTTGALLASRRRLERGRVGGCAPNARLDT